MKTLNYLLILLSSGALLAGCATSDKPVYGGLGNTNEIENASGGSPVTPPPADETSGPRDNGANGSVSRSNPFGIGGANASPSIPQ
jgi:hypothetical protein